MHWNACMWKMALIFDGSICILIRIKYQKAINMKLSKWFLIHLHLPAVEVDDKRCWEPRKNLGASSNDSIQITNSTTVCFSSAINNHHLIKLHLPPPDDKWCEQPRSLEQRQTRAFKSRTWVAINHRLASPGEREKDNLFKKRKIKPRAMALAEHSNHSTIVC